MAFKLPTGYEAYFKEWENKVGAFTEFFPDKNIHYDLAGGGDADLKGRPFAIKDNIALEGFSLSCASKMLEGFKAPYTAAAVEKLLAAGCIPIGKTNLDEFGMGSSTDTSAIKRTNNPWDVKRTAGGSSGGSAAAVAAGLVPFALGSDTGGSVRLPAAFCGVAGLKPTYGAVSRYGLVSYASSLEGIGVIADSVSLCRKVFGVIQGSDVHDMSSKDAPEPAPPLYGPALQKKGIIGVLSPDALAKLANSCFGAGVTETEMPAQNAGLEDEVLKGFETAKSNLQNLGFSLEEVELPILKYGVPAYYTIASAEASSNLARFDGIRYGKHPCDAKDQKEFISKAREAGFGPEVKLRLLLGTFVLRSGFQDRYYLKAQGIRAGIKRSFEALLGDSDYTDSAVICDAILLPVFPVCAFERGVNSLSPFAQKAADLFTCCANLAGLPALSFPASVEGGFNNKPRLPVGVQLIGRAFAERILLDIAEDYEKAHPFPHPDGYKKFWG